MEKPMTIESKQTKVTVSKVWRAVCDNCKNELDSVTIYQEHEKTEYETLETGDFSLDGIHLSFKAGYGTPYDTSDFNLTLCTNCLADMVKQFGGIIRE